MAETARRVRYGHGSDILRRLIARPIRMDRVRLAPEATDLHDEIGEGTDGSGKFEHLRAEMAIMKAALAAERDDSAELRSRIRFVGDAAEPLGEEALAVRDRWAALVDDLLRARL